MNKLSFLLLLVVCMWGCAKGNDASVPPVRENYLRKNDSPLFIDLVGADFLAHANNKSASIKTRSAAIFALFTKKVKQGMNSDELFQALDNPNWLDEIAISKWPGFRTGWWIDLGGQEFTVRLFPDKNVNSEFHIDLGFSENVNLTEDDVRKFLKGESGTQIKLKEFALNFPSPTHAIHTELFWEKGVHIYYR